MEPLLEHLLQLQDQVTQILRLVSPSKQVESSDKIAQALSAQFYSNDLDKIVTVKEYLLELLKALWIEADGFSGKRPLGNSGWQYDVALPLIKLGLIRGTLDSEGDINTMDSQSLDKLIISCIESL